MKPRQAPPNRVTITLNSETLAFYRQQAMVQGLPLTEVVRRLLERGQLLQNLEVIEARIGDEVTKFTALVECRPWLPTEELLMSVFASEELLSAIVMARSPQELWDAKDKERGRERRSWAAAIRLKGPKGGGRPGGNDVAIRDRRTLGRRSLMGVLITYRVSPAISSKRIAKNTRTQKWRWSSGHEKVIDRSRNIQTRRIGIPFKQEFAGHTPCGEIG